MGDYLSPLAEMCLLDLISRHCRHLVCFLFNQLSHYYMLSAHFNALAAPATLAEEIKSPSGPLPVYHWEELHDGLAALLFRPGVDSARGRRDLTWCQMCPRCGVRVERWKWRRQPEIDDLLPALWCGRAFFGPSEGESEGSARPSTVVTEEKQNPFSLSLVPSSQIHSVHFMKGCRGGGMRCSWVKWVNMLHSFCSADLISHKTHTTDFAAF